VVLLPPPPQDTAATTSTIATHRDRGAGVRIRRTSVKYGSRDTSRRS
jgi:hypothetical protein